jgi:hypothetical protein
VKQGLPGDGHDRASACKHPQNDPWGVVNSARKNLKKKMEVNNILFTSNCKYCPHMPSNSIKRNLGKIIPVALKYLSYAMQNYPCGTPQPQGSDLALVKYPHGSD